MCPGSYCRVGRSVKSEVIDPAEFFDVVDLRLIMIPVIISLNNVEKILFISHGDRVVVFISCRYFSALRSGCDPADSEHREKYKESKKSCAKD